MKITMYELLGMVKDGTQPNHIKYRDEEWWWGYDTYTYFADLERTPDAQANMFTRYVINYCLDDEVEILEEEKKIPKKINNVYTKQSIEDMKEARFNSNDMAKICNRIGWLMENRNELGNKIDEIIDYLDYLKSKGE